MKLRCFTSLIATIFVASTAGATEVYNKDGNVLTIFGNIVGGQFFSKKNINNVNNMSVKYGLVSETCISNNIIGFGTWEHEFSLKNVEDGINLRDNGRPLLGYLGIKFGDFGSFDYGRNYGVLYDVGSWTDLIPEFESDLSFSDNFLSGRASNLITYRNKNFFGFLDGFDFSIQYQGKNNVDQIIGRTIKTANGEGYGISASYTLRNGIAASAAYANSNRIFAQRSLDSTYNSTNSPAEAYSFGIKYDNYGAYVAAVYGETFKMTPFGNFDDILNPDSLYGFVNKARNISVIAQYRFNCGLIPSVSYIHSNSIDSDSRYCNDVKKCVTFSGIYEFNKQLSTSVGYRLNLLNKNDFTTFAQINIDDMFSLGISYLF